MAPDLADLAIWLINAQANLRYASRDGINNLNDFVADFHEANSEVAGLDEADSRELALLLSDTATQLLMAHIEGMPLDTVRALLHDNSSRGWRTVTRIDRRGVPIPDTVVDPWAAQGGTPF